MQHIFSRHGAAHWLKQADEARIKAEKPCDPLARRTMMRVRQTYLDLAKSSGVTEAETKGNLSD